MTALFDEVEVLLDELSEVVALAPHVIGYAPRAEVFYLLAPSAVHDAEYVSSPASHLQRAPQKGQHVLGIHHLEMVGLANFLVFGPFDGFRAVYCAFGLEQWGGVDLQSVAI